MVCNKKSFFVFAVITFYVLVPGCSIKQDKEKTAELAQEEQPIEIVIPEVYELANVILAITDYGIADESEIHKGTKYYDEMMVYFKPYRNHPLLKKVNYSRDLWEDLLSFRTDAIAFSFDSSGNLKRDFPFFANEGHKPFDTNLDLINDFAKKSNFRQFFNSHKQFYESVLNRYSSYYMVKEMRLFLDSLAGSQAHSASAVKYKIVLSPFVGRMQCHRDLDSLTAADFIDVSDELLEKKASDTLNREAQALDIHTVFTEMDHGYVNPITDKFYDTLMKKFDYKKWDRDSGYEEENCFNEYMTWGLYDLFLDKYFPEYSRDKSIQWHYQNTVRGFYASSLFASKLKELIKGLKKGEKLEVVYPKILDWCHQIQENLSVPKMLLKQDTTYAFDPSKPLKLPFSEPMKKDFDTVDLYVSKMKNGEQVNEGIMLKLKPSDVTWEKNVMGVEKKIPYSEFFILFNWWGLPNAMLSEKGVMLKPQSYTNFKIKSRDKK